MKRILLFPVEGVLIKELPTNNTSNLLQFLEFQPASFQTLLKLQQQIGFKLALFNKKSFSDKADENDLFEHKIIQYLKNEGIHIEGGIAQLDTMAQFENYFEALVKKLELINNEKVDLANSFLICSLLDKKLIAEKKGLGFIYFSKQLVNSHTVSAQHAENWSDIYKIIRLTGREHEIHRVTNETDVYVKVQLDTDSEGEISTGLHFFDHMLDQISRHSGCTLTIKVKGDLQVDEHHTIEDTAIALGEAFHKAIGNKAGIERYGFIVPMDESQAQAVIDFSGRAWLIWDTEFKREMVGDVPTEMFKHFFKSFSDAAKCNLHIKATGNNEHHKIEGIFKAVAKAIRMAIKRDPDNMKLPSTKGML